MQGPTAPVAITRPGAAPAEPAAIAALPPGLEPDDQAPASTAPLMPGQVMRAP